VALVIRWQFRWDRFAPTAHDGVQVQLDAGHAWLVGCAVVDLDLKRIDGAGWSRKKRAKGRE
jgi:hypothetical protein